MGYVRVKPNRYNLGAYSDNSGKHINYKENWNEVPEIAPYINPYRLGWEQFLSHVLGDTPMTSNYVSGIRDVQLAEACVKSAESRKWIPIGPKF